MAKGYSDITLRTIWGKYNSITDKWTYTGLSFTLPEEFDFAILSLSSSWNHGKPIGYELRMTLSDSEDYKISESYTCPDRLSKSAPLFIISDHETRYFYMLHSGSSGENEARINYFAISSTNS